jgi:hypothetical protein
VPGQIRFYPKDAWQRVFRYLLRMSNRTLYNQSVYPDLVVGYGAGNVPGTALLIILLALAATLTGNAPPVVIVKNSRREPIFTPQILSGLEAIAPELVSTVAVLIWDYADAVVRNVLLPQADLVIAAASDESIEDIQAQLEQAGRDQVRFRTSRSPTDRACFHAHGHKVSFSAIGKEILKEGLIDPESGQPLIEIITLLAALDSAFWDQFGCLSSRFHFVERGGDYSPQAYAEQLVNQFRLLSDFLPRGAWPKRQLRDSFDLHKMLETTGEVQVFSEYEDDFVVTLDERPLAPSSFFSMVNSCQGRVVIVRPVDDLMQIPDHYLRMLPAENLQSLSVAVAYSLEGLSTRFLQFAEACADRGITAIRTVGRGAFPQLSYSWDGFIPLDLVRQRPSGRFTTIEFDHPYNVVLHWGSG